MLRHAGSSSSFQTPISFHLPLPFAANAGALPRLIPQATFSTHFRGTLSQPAFTVRLHNPPRCSPPRPVEHPIAESLTHAAACKARRVYTSSERIEAIGAPPCRRREAVPGTRPPKRSPLPAPVHERSHLCSSTSPPSWIVTARTPWQLTPSARPMAARAGAPKVGFDAIPMWVADMNFPTAPSVIEAISKRLEHPSFGYFRPRKEYFDAIIGWQERRNGVQGLKPEHIGYENGVIGGLVSRPDRIHRPQGDHILRAQPHLHRLHQEHSPTSAATSSRTASLCSTRAACGAWTSTTWSAGAARRAHPRRRVLLAPQPLTGRVWERWEIERAMELYRKVRLRWLSPTRSGRTSSWTGNKHIPDAVGERGRAASAQLALYAPTKTFSLAGLVGSVPRHLQPLPA